MASSKFPRRTRDPRPEASPPASPPRPAGRRLAVVGGATAAAGLLILAAVAAWPRLSPLRATMTQEVPRPAAIDGNRAYSYLQQSCALGPRIAGSEASTRQRQLAADHFRRLGGEVREQRFTGVDPLSGRTIQLANLIGSWAPEKIERILICAHYDTRPYADQEQDPRRRRLPFVGANDPGSGVALIMELAHHLRDSSTPYGVDLVLLDAEELVYDRTGEYFLGSKAFGRAYRARRRSEPNGPRYVAGILLDMVGGKNLTIEREPYSVQLAPWLVEEVWTVAEQIGARSFRRAYGREVMDDHLPLNDAGIPTIDIIDFDYPHWHLASDTPEQCSPESLAEVGRVVTAWLGQHRARRR